MVRTISFELLYGLVILRHARRQLVRIAVTSNPTAEWIGGQVTEAFPWEEASRHLVRDRDGAFGPAFTHRETKCAIAGDIPIAYQIIGDGPRDLAFIPSPCRRPGAAERTCSL